MDEYQREQCSSLASASSLGVRNVDVAHSDKRLPMSHFQETGAGFTNYVNPPPVPSGVQDRLCSDCCLDETVPKSQDLGKSDENVLNIMMGMLEQVMDRVQQGHNIHPERNVNFRYRCRARGCGVCGNTAHSTKSYCLKDRLCFVCFSPGHAHSACPQPQSGN